MRIGRWAWIATVVLVAGCGSAAGDSPQGRQVQGGACGDLALPATMEAEGAQHAGVQVASDVQGFSGSGYVTGFADVGDEVSFSICAPEAGYYTVEFAYAKGTDGLAKRTLLVDGKAFPAHPMFPPLWEWSTWKKGGRRALHLAAGEHTLTVAFRDGDTGDLRLDALRLSKGPSPSEISVRALLQNDWDDLVLAWHAGKLYPADDRNFGPRMAALHSKRDWPTNQLDEAQAFLRDDTGGTAYDDPNQFFTNAWFTASDEERWGELRVDFGTYGVKALPFSMTRRQIVPPHEAFALVLYDVGNSTGGARELSLLEWADLHNKTTGPSEDKADTGEVSPPDGELKAEWDAEHHAWIADLRDTNGVVLVIGAFGEVDHHVAGEPVSGASDKDAPTVKAFFGDPSSLADAGSGSGTDLGVGLSRSFTLDAGGTTEVAFFYGVADSPDAARSLAAKIRSKTPAEWADQSSTAWKEWIDSGKGTSVQPDVPEWGDALRGALVLLRQSQQPEFGTFVAATNPGYFYSVWPRDAAVTAMGLDAAGYLDVGEKYWKWMAQAQADGSNPDFPEGTWWTNYSYWKQQEGITFVSPEWDSLGLFLVGVYHHHEALKAIDAGRASKFLDDVWPAVRNAANFIRDRQQDGSNHGFGPPDFSIWEEDLAYNTFTQATYVAGLRAAELLAGTRDESHGWGGSADVIRQAIFRNVDAGSCAGLWNGDRQYFIRSVHLDCTPNKIVDASSDILWVLGVLRPDDPMATQHRDAVLANLTPSEDFGYGISRYEGDNFYYSAEFSPGGAYEAEASMPTWPQMTMYMAMLEHWLGKGEEATNRLSWYVSTTPWGYMPQGEAVDWSTQRPLISTASEPVTGAWFVLALMNHLGAFDPRVPPHDAWKPGGAGGGMLRR